MKLPKKSENLEIRLSHADKQNLQARAAREGRSVSHVVRRLISDYLAQSIPDTQSSFFARLHMTLKSKPKTIVATLACLPIFAAPVFMSTPAMAEDLSLSLKGEFIKQIEDEKRTRSFETELHLQDGQFFTMRMPSLSVQGTETGLYMVVDVSEKEDEVSIKFTICEVVASLPTEPNLGVMTSIDTIDICKGKNILSQPTLTTRHGAEVSFQMGHPSGETLKISALPKKL